jgi:hypothetical protein
MVDTAAHAAKAHPAEELAGRVADELSGDGLDARRVGCDYRAAPASAVLAAGWPSSGSWAVIRWAARRSRARGAAHLSGRGAPAGAPGTDGPPGDRGQRASAADQIVGGRSTAASARPAADSVSSRLELLEVAGSAAAIRAAEHGTRPMRRGRRVRRSPDRRRARVPPAAHAAGRRASGRQAWGRAAGRSGAATDMGRR